MRGRLTNPALSLLVCIRSLEGLGTHTRPKSPSLDYGKCVQFSKGDDYPTAAPNRPPGAHRPQKTRFPSVESSTSCKEEPEQCSQRSGLRRLRRLLPEGPSAGLLIPHKLWNPSISPAKPGPKQYGQKVREHCLNCTSCAGEVFSSSFTLGTTAPQRREPVRLLACWRNSASNAGR